MVSDGSNGEIRGNSLVFNGLKRFWRDESGVLTSDFAVVAALMAAVGVMLYTATGESSRQLVNNTGMVIGPGGPNYSIDGSGPLDAYASGSATFVETGTTGYSGGDFLIETVY